MIGLFKIQTNSFLPASHRGSSAQLQEWIVQSVAGRVEISPKLDICNVLSLLENKSHIDPEPYTEGWHKTSLSQEPPYIPCTVTVLKEVQ